MIKPFSLLLIFVSLLLSCKQKDNSSSTLKSKLKLSFEVIPEDLDGGYSIEWYDTLGQSEYHQLEDKWRRPKEVWCFITNDNKDTLGYYRGLSSPHTFTNFQSKDTSVTLTFMVGVNIFSDKQKEVMYYSRAHNLPITYQPIQINLKNNLRKKIEVELQEM